MCVLQFLKKHRKCISKRNHAGILTFQNLYIHKTGPSKSSTCTYWTEASTGPSGSDSPISTCTGPSSRAWGPCFWVSPPFLACSPPGVAGCEPQAGPQDLLLPPCSSSDPRESSPSGKSPGRPGHSTQESPSSFTSSQAQDNHFKLVFFFPHDFNSNLLKEKNC